MFKVNNKNTRTRCEIRHNIRHGRRSYVFIKYYYIPISFDLFKRVLQLKTVALIEKSCWSVTTRERVSEVYVSESGVMLYRQ